MLYSSLVLYAILKITHHISQFVMYVQMSKQSYFYISTTIVHVQLVMHTFISLTQNNMIIKYFYHPLLDLIASKVCTVIELWKTNNFCVLMPS